MTGAAVIVATAGAATLGVTMTVDTQVLAHDIRYFAIAYAIAIAVARSPRPWIRC